MLLLMLLAMAGCAAEPAPPPAFNGTDVMFLRMSLGYIDQGQQVVALTARRAAAPRVRALGAELAAQWRAEADTMRRWLADWRQPPSADPAAHAGHSDPHSLRPADLAELAATPDPDFDGTAVRLLLGHLHNCVEVSRMEAAGGRYPPARALAETMTTHRQAQIRQLLTLAA